MAVTTDLTEDISDVGEQADSASASPTLLYAIKQVELAIRSHMDAVLRPMGVTALQYTALTVLRRRGPECFRPRCPIRGQDNRASGSGYCFPSIRTGRNR